MTRREKILLVALMFVALSSGVLVHAANPAVGANGIDFTRLVSNVCPAGSHTCLHADNSGNLLQFRSDLTSYVVAASPAPTAGQCLTYNTAGVWTPGTCASGGGITIGDSVSGGDDESLLFVAGGAKLSQSTDLTWNGSRLTVAGDLTIGGDIDASSGTVTGNHLAIDNGSGFVGTMTSAVAASGKTWTFPNATGTVGLLSLAQTWSAAQTFSGGITLSSNVTTNGFLGPNYGGTSTNVSAPSWTAVSYQNSYVDNGGGYPATGYYKDALGQVHIQGAAKDGTGGASIFTLPAGFRPASGHKKIFPCFVDTGIGFVWVQDTGVVQATAGGTTGVFFGELIFAAEQ